MEPTWVPLPAPHTPLVKVQAKPVPLVLRFPHPTARYEDATDGVDVDSKTTYLVFGPGQAFPFTREVADASGTANQKEPHPGRIVTSGNTWASVPLDESLSSDRQLFPNSIANEKGNFLPPTGAYYAATAGWHWRAVVNWETPAGYSWKGKWSQRAEHGRHYGQQFNDDTPYDISGTAQIGIDLTHIHPKMHTPTIGFGITMAADTVWHMDGGFHPGGHWMDNQITFNPRQPAKNFRVLSSVWERANQIHPTAFRTAGVLTGRILDYIGTTEAVQTTDLQERLRGRGCHALSEWRGTRYRPRSSHQRLPRCWCAQVPRRYAHALDGQLDEARQIRVDRARFLMHIYQ